MPGCHYSPVGCYGMPKTSHDGFAYINDLTHSHLFYTDNKTSSVPLVNRTIKHILHIFPFSFDSVQLSIKEQNKCNEIYKQGNCVTAIFIMAGSCSVFCCLCVDMLLNLVEGDHLLSPWLVDRTLMQPNRLTTLRITATEFRQQERCESPSTPYWYLLTHPGHGQGLQTTTIMKIAVMSLCHNQVM